MADRSILYRLRAALQAGFVAVAEEIELLATHVGIISGTNNLGEAIKRVDATGVGANIVPFTGTFEATNANIDTWFGGRQQNRLRWTDDGAILPLTFTLPGTTALTTAFNTLAAGGVPETLRFVLEYTGPGTSTLRIIPRAGGPQIRGTSSIIVRSGVAATVEITRTSGVIDEYIFQAIGGIGDATGGSLDSIKLINPSVANWDASATGVLPSSGVIKGNAYKVVNAPSDGSGRFGEVMVNDDWVIWEGETFTSWSSEPHLWSVLPAHEVRRITALEQDFLTDVTVTPVSDRNSVVRGANYADSAGEIRLKIYPTVADYSPADLNTTGDIDEYTDPSSQTGHLAIRLTGTQSTLEDVLPTLYIYSDDGADTFVKIFNIDRDFAHQGDFGGESDYISNETIDYQTGTTLRVYIGQDIDRYTHLNLDIFESNLSSRLQGLINSREAWSSVADVLFSGATVRDVHVADRVVYSPGYSRGVDWRDMSQSTTITDDRYLDSDLTISVNLAAFTVTGFGNTLQKFVGLRLQRNDANSGTGAMMEIGNGEAFIRVNTSNELQFNTTLGEGLTNWVGISGGGPNLTLSNTANNFIFFEIVPRQNDSGPIANEFEVVGVFYDGTTYTQLNNINFSAVNGSHGDNLGFSRSANQRGQVTQFKAINSPGYITHAQLETILRQHQDDKWDFGYARLFEGSTNKEVVFQTLISSPNTVVAATAPTVAPGTIGDIYVNTALKQVYIAVGTTEAGDWELMN